VQDKPLPPGGLAGNHFASNINRLTHRLWLQRALTVLARTAWLPLLIGALWLGVELAGGPALNWWALVWIEVALLVPAMIFTFLVKPSRRQVARMLDRSFALQERMLTAVDNVGIDVPEPGAVPTVTYLQMADAANVISELRAHPAFRIRPPVREIVIATVLALSMASLFFMRGVSGGIPDLTSDSVPKFVPAAQRLAQAPKPAPEANAAVADAPTKQQVQAMAEKSNQAQQDLKKLADALGDQAVTREAADAIQRGDYAKAADLIRQVADNADQLSQSAREGLANDLDQAASQMSPGDNSLAQASKDAASGLREGGDAAKGGMSDLGDAVDQTASNIVSQQDLADQMSQAQAAESNSASNGESGQSGDPSQGDPSSSDQQGGDSSQQQGAESSSSSDQSGANDQSGQNNGNSQGQGNGQNGSGNQDQSKAGGSSGQAGDPRSGGQGQPEGAPQPGQGSQPGEAGDRPGSDSAQSSGGDPASGAGAGTTNNEKSGSNSGKAADGADPSQNPNASDPKVTDASGKGGNGQDAQTDPRSAITLSRSPDGENVQTGGTSGSSSNGSGSGSTVSSGSSVQGEVGSAGPDSNHVPTEYRGIVQDYFTDDGS
jgi:hypothetical protein